MDDEILMEEEVLRVDAEQAPAEPEAEGTFTLGPVDEPTLNLTGLDGLLREQDSRRPQGAGLLFGGTTSGITGQWMTTPIYLDPYAPGGIGRREPMATEFQVGDRVENVWTGRNTEITTGTRGIITEVRQRYQNSHHVGYQVEWEGPRDRLFYSDYFLLRPDGDSDPHWGVAAIRRVERREVGEVAEAVRVEIRSLTNLTATEPQVVETAPSRVLVNGDRVVYVGPQGRVEDGNPQIPYGTVGILSGCSGEGDGWDGTVRWANNGGSWHYGRYETMEWWLASALCHVDDWLDPEFPYRVGMRVNHRQTPSAALTAWLDGTNGLWEGEILEIDREGGRIRVAHESDLGANGAWWTRENRDLNIAKMVPIEGQTGVVRKEIKMISTCSLQAELETAEKTALGRWIKGVLDNPTGDNRFPPGLTDKIAVCYQGQIRLLRDERWLESPPYLYVGRVDRAGERGQIPVSHRLAVAMTLMQMVDASEELKGAARAALGRYLLGEYQELSKGVVIVSKKKPEGLAFSADRVAAKIGDEWVLPTTGEPVKVDGGEWTICSM